MLGARRPITIPVTIATTASPGIVIPIISTPSPTVSLIIATTVTVTVPAVAVRVVFARMRRLTSADILPFRLYGSRRRILPPFRDYFLNFFFVPLELTYERFEIVNAILGACALILCVCEKVFMRFFVFLTSSK